MTLSNSSTSARKKGSGSLGGSGKVSKVRKPSVARLKKKADDVFSRYIRNTFSKDGKCSCYTCGKVMDIKQAQCGHFISRVYTATRWSVDNCRPQCVGCNIFGGGKPLDFEEHLVREIGFARVQELKRSRHNIVRLTPAYLELIIDLYA